MRVDLDAAGDLLVFDTVGFLVLTGAVLGLVPLSPSMILDLSSRHNASFPVKIIIFK